MVIEQPFRLVELERFDGFDQTGFGHGSVIVIEVRVVGDRPGQDIDCRIVENHATIGSLDVDWPVPMLAVVASSIAIACAIFAFTITLGLTRSWYAAIAGGVVVAVLVT